MLLSGERRALSSGAVSLVKAVGAVVLAIAHYVGRNPRPIPTGEVTNTVSLVIAGERAVAPAVTY
jgi:hypothetical protein